MPLFWLGICFIVGIFSGTLFLQPENIRVFLLISSSAAGLAELFLVQKKNHPLRRIVLFQVPFSFLVLAFLLGNWSCQNTFPVSFSSENHSVDTINDAIVTGMVISDPVETNRWVTATLRLEQIIIENTSFSSQEKLSLFLPAAYHLEYGDVLLLVGDLEPALDADTGLTNSYLASKGILWSMDFPMVEILAFDQGSRIMDSIYALRTRAYENILDWFPFPESVLLSGILLGIDWNFPDFLEEAYRTTGTIHIIAISGFNIALVTGLVTRLFRKILPNYWDGVLAAAAVVFYTILVGADPTVTRAAIMGIIAIPAYYIGRRIIGVNLLTITAAIMLAFNPLLLWNTSFQLSFLATLGLMVIADPLNNLIANFISKWSSDKLAEFASPVILIISSTIAAQFAVLPVLYHFDPSLKLFSLLANLFILPLQPPLMIFGGLAILLGLFIPTIGAIVAKIAWPFAALSNRVAVRMSLYHGAKFGLPEWVWIPAAVIVGIVITWMSVREICGLNRSEDQIFEDQGNRNQSIG